MDDNTQKLIDRVRKLFAKANDASVTEAEALAYAAKAQELLEQHNLSLLDVSEEEKKDGIGRFTWAPKYADMPWRRIVSSWAAKVYMCKRIRTKMKIEVRGGKLAWRPAYILVGRQVNVEIAKSMIDYLFSTVVRLSKDYSTNQKERHLFEAGCGLRLATRLREMYEASAVKPTTSGSNLPALYSQELALVDDWAKENMDLRDTKGAELKLDWMHSANGAAAAEGISLSGQIGGRKDVNVPLPPGAIQIGGADHRKLVAWLEKKFGDEDPGVPVPGVKWIGKNMGFQGSNWEVFDSTELQKFIDEQPEKD